MLTETQVHQVTSLLSSLLWATNKVRTSKTAICASLLMIATSLKLDIKDVLLRWEGISGQRIKPEEVENSDIKVKMLMSYANYTHTHQLKQDPIQIIQIEML